MTRNGNARNQAALTPEQQALNDQLLRAAMEGSAETVMALVGLGANVHARNNLGYAALMCAAMNGHAETVTALATEGADVNARNKFGWTALMLAAMNGHAETVTALLERGAEVDARDNGGCTALMCAAMNGHTETVTALLGRGADVNALDNDGYTALIWAVRDGRTETATLLQDIATIQTTIPDPAKAGGGYDWLALLPRLAEPMVQLNLHPLAATLAAVILADGSDEGREAVERINLSQVQRGNSALNVKRVERLGELNSTLYPKLLETAKANLTTIHPQETEDDHQGRAEERAKKIDNSVILSLLQPGVLKNISDQFQVSKSGNLKPNLPEQLPDGVILENLLPKLPDATEHEREHVAHAIADFFRKQNEDAVAVVEKRAEKRNKLSKLRTFDDQRVWLPKRPTSSASSSAAAAPRLTEAKKASEQDTEGKEEDLNNLIESKDEAFGVKDGNNHQAPPPAPTPQSSTTNPSGSRLSIGGKGADGGRGENGEGGGRT